MDTMVHKQINKQVQLKGFEHDIRCSFITKVLFAFLLPIIISLVAKAQTENYELAVGKEIPRFRFNKIHHYSLERAEPENFRGKWLVLDFWSQYCASCIGSFPKLNQLQKKFSDEIQFLLIGCLFKGTNLESTKAIYEKSRNYYDLIIPTVYDSTYYEKLGIKGNPYIIIIDTEGIVRSISNSISEELLTSLLYSDVQNEVIFPKLENKVNYSSNQDSKIKYKSTITNWNKEVKGDIRHLPSYIFEGNELRIHGADLTNLFYYALTGCYNTSIDAQFRNEYYPTFIFETQDKKDFLGDKATGNRMYSYDLRVEEKVTKNKLMAILYEDLKNCFGFQVEVEIRYLPCWNVSIKDDIQEKIKANTYTSLKKVEIDRIILKNQPFEELINSLNSLFKKTQPPFNNLTNINYNIDFEIESLLLDFDNLKTQLEDFGVLLTKGVKEFKVIVVKSSIAN